MNNPKYQAIIKSATETRNVDFKGPMNWRTATKCEKFEILKDIAAMSNAGGGVLVIGRDSPGHTTGSLDFAQEGSFDPTEVNKFAHLFLDPRIECRVEIEKFGADTLAIIDVPEFDSTPLIFKAVGNCGDKGCKTPHFRPGDVYTRTKAQQSQRISDADEMRELISRGIRKSSESLVTEMQRMLSAPTSHEEPLPTSPYDEIRESEGRDFFDRYLRSLPDSVGIFDMSIAPVEFRAERLQRNRLNRDIREFAYVVQHGGIFYSVPFEETTDGENFDDGCRLFIQKPEWARVEGVSLHQSGLYRIVRVFQEDYTPSTGGAIGKLILDDRTLWLDRFVEQMTMFHLLARNVSRALVATPEEEVQFDLRVSGLAGRRLEMYDNTDLHRLFLGIFGTHKGTKNAFTFPLRTTLRELEISCVRLARERCEKILFTFGVHNPIETGVQRRFLGNTEPIAFPT